MKIFRCTIVMVGVWALVACEDEKPQSAASEPSAEPSAEKPATPAVAAGEPASQPVSGQLKLSPANAKIQFVGAKLVGSHNGAFESFSGSVDYQNSDPLSAKIKVEIDLGSVKTDAEKLDAHLRSPDFFDVQKFPKASFVSTGIAAGGRNGASHTVTGDLDLHGVKKSISFPANIQVSGKHLTVASEFTINRKDFGIVYPGMPDNLIKDDVVIRLSIDGGL